MRLCKLDTYDYTVLPGVIRIRISGNTDPVMVDILSEIEKAGGNIYVEGKYYFYLERYEVCTDGKDSYMELEVGKM